MFETMLADGSMVGSLLNAAVQHKTNDKPMITVGC